MARARAMQFQTTIRLTHVRVWEDHTETGLWNSSSLLGTTQVRVKLDLALSIKHNFLATRLQCSAAFSSQNTLLAPFFTQFVRLIGSQQ